MKTLRIPKLVLCRTFSAEAITAQSPWTGMYEFSEYGGRTAGDTGIVNSHEIEITDGGAGREYLTQAKPDKPKL